MVELRQRGGEANDDDYDDPPAAGRFSVAPRTPGSRLPGRRLRPAALSRGPPAALAEEASCGGSRVVPVWAACARRCLSWLLFLAGRFVVSARVLLVPVRGVFRLVSGLLVRLLLRSVRGSGCPLPACPLIRGSGCPWLPLVVASGSCVSGCCACFLCPASGCCCRCLASGSRRCFALRCLPAECAVPGSLRSRGDFVEEVSRLSCRKVPSFFRGSLR